ncbi:hypothetical protein GCM10027160_14840 [Streptomyces calidiresistens]
MAPTIPILMGLLRVLAVTIVATLPAAPAGRRCPPPAAGVHSCASARVSPRRAPDRGTYPALSTPIAANPLTSVTPRDRRTEERENPPEGR